MSKAKLAVLISGSGSNLQAIIDACESGLIPAEIKLVLSNKPGVKGLARAEAAGIDTKVIEHKAFDERLAFDQAMISAIDTYNVDAVILAGFMRILTPEFTEHYLGRMLNIHPSLLPKYPGLQTHQRAIDAGDKHAGASIHFVTAELDGGPVVLQAKVDIDDDESADSLAAKVLKQEHQIFPLAVKWLCENRLSLKDNAALFEGEALPETGRLYESKQVSLTSSK